MEQPRDHYYHFAQVFLRDLALARPEWFFAHIAHDAPRVLAAAWATGGDWVFEEDRLPCPVMSATLRQLDDDTNVAVVSMPTPQGEAEPWFIVILEYTWHGTEGRSGTFVRYFLLEYWRLENEEPPSRLTEWSRDGSCHIWRYGLSAEVDSVLETIAELHRARLLPETDSAD